MYIVLRWHLGNVTKNGTFSGREKLRIIIHIRIISTSFKYRFAVLNGKLVPSNLKTFFVHTPYISIFPDFEKFRLFAKCTIQLNKKCTKEINSLRTFWVIESETTSPIAYWLSEFTSPLKQTYSNLKAITSSKKGHFSPLVNPRHYWKREFGVARIAAGAFHSIASISTDWIFCMKNFVKDSLITEPIQSHFVIESRRNTCTFLPTNGKREIGHLTKYFWQWQK